MTRGAGQHDIFIPDHAYIPGRNARHREDLFDAIKQSAQPNMPLEGITTSTAMVHAAHYLNHGYYWECHEVLEAVWMALIDHPEERRSIQGVIQIANGLLKIAMGQPRAASRLYTIASELLYISHDNLPIAGSDLWAAPIWTDTGLPAEIVQQALNQLKHHVKQYNA